MIPNKATDLITQSTGLPNEFAGWVELRLQSLGYELQERDIWLVAFEMQSVANRIKSECNVPNVPEGLYQVAVDMVCGGFLLAKKNSGQLDGFTVDLNAVALKQVQEGDTNVSYATESTKSPEQRLDVVINHLLTYGKEQFITHRKLKWT